MYTLPQRKISTLPQYLLEFNDWQPSPKQVAVEKCIKDLIEIADDSGDVRHSQLMPLGMYTAFYIFCQKTFARNVAPHQRENAVFHQGEIIALHQEKRNSLIALLQRPKGNVDMVHTLRSVQLTCISTCFHTLPTDWEETAASHKPKRLKPGTAHVSDRLPDLLEDEVEALIMSRVEYILRLLKEDAPPGVF